MPYDIIELTAEDLATTPVLEAFDARLKQALTKTQRVVPLKLRPEVDNCSMGLEWLEQWSRRFLQAGKVLVIIPATQFQRQCLEISHPDQNLTFKESIDELEAAYPELVEPETPVNVPPADPLPETAATRRQSGAEQPASHRTVEVQSQQMMTPYRPPQAREEAPAEESTDFETATPYEEMLPGTISEVSGEYACKSCGNHRMWLKGDLVTACTEQECLDPERGWKLSCDLF